MIIQRASMRVQHLLVPRASQTFITGILGVAKGFRQAIGIFQSDHEGMWQDVGAQS